MATYNFTSLGAAARAIARDSKARDKRVRQAVVKAAKVTAKVVAKDIAPKAFGELADSIHWGEATNGAYVIADAPHAEAVEVGSRPHTPPLEPIIAWVRLRGMQGISKKGNVIRHTKFKPVSNTGAQKQGSNTAAVMVGRYLKERLGNASVMRAWRMGMAFTDPATLAVARAIQHQISVHGTKPFRYMLAGVTTAMSALDEFVTIALQDK